MRNASCACGQLKLECSEEPSLVSLCHCQQCQKRTGSTFGIAAFFPKNVVTVTGATRRYTRTSDSGHAITFHFCPQCGSTVYWEPERKPDMLAVAVGAFSDPDYPAPTQAVFTEHRHRWLNDPPFD